MQEMTLDTLFAQGQIRLAEISVLTGAHSIIYIQPELILKGR